MIVNVNPNPRMKTTDTILMRSIKQLGKVFLFQMFVRLKSKINM